MNRFTEKILECHEFAGLASCFQPFLEYEKFKESKQLAVTSKTGNDLFDGVGSLYDFAKYEYVAKTSEYVTLNKEFVGSEVAKIYSLVRNHIFEKFGFHVGRVRLMRLEPKTCYTYHKDPEEFRFHLPLQSNKNCFFVVDDTVCRMEELLTLYKIKTNIIHTAVNASTELRDHLVFDTYLEE